MKEKKKVYLRDKRKVISLINVYKFYTIKEKEIFELLKNLSKNGKCIIVVSHSSLVKKYADYVYTIENNSLVGES